MFPIYMSLLTVCNFQPLNDLPQRNNNTYSP
jgi:hypothetical protein